jgi:hypothetical protein
MIKFDVKQVDIDNIKKQFELDKEEMDKASRRAIKKTCQWMVTKITGELASILGIKKSELQRRIRTKIERILIRGKIWFGLNRISMGRFNSVRQNKFGVVTSKFGVKKAFLVPSFVKKKDASVPVFKRTGEYTIPTKGRYIGRIIKRAGKISGSAGSKLKRESEKKQLIDIDGTINAFVDKTLLSDFYDVFLTKLKQESNFQVIKRG